MTIDYSAFGTFLVGAVPVGAGIMLFIFNSWQAKKIKAELIEKLQDAVNKGHQFSVRQIFSTLYDLPLPQTDIEALMASERSSQIIQVLRDVPWYIQYEHATLGHRGMFQPKTLRLLLKILYWLMTIVPTLGGLLSSIVFLIRPGQFTTLLYSMLVCAAWAFLSMDKLHSIRMADRLLLSNGQLQLAPPAHTDNPASVPAA